MNVLEHLVTCAGQWRGSSRLYDPRSSRPEDSPATATITPVLGGRFVRIEYTWGHQGEPQEGSMLIGLDPKAHLVSTQWIDTWHMGRAVMSCVGTARDAQAFSVRGSYAAPPGPDWGWRIDVDMSHPRMLRLTMTNISPEGTETIAVEASLTQS